MKLLHRLRGEMETARLLLRRWKRDDFQEYVQLMSDPEVMLPAGAEPASTLEKAMTAFHRDQRNEGCFAITLKETGQVVGRIKFQSDLRRFHVKSLSLGYELRRDCWGNGYMPEALRAMIVRAFEREKVDVLGISHFSENTRSRRVIEKCGFRYEGTIHHAVRRSDGEIMDDMCYCILREDYPAWKELYGSGVESDQPLLEQENLSYRREK